MDIKTFQECDCTDFNLIFSVKLMYEQVRISVMRKNKGFLYTVSDPNFCGEDAYERSLDDGLDWPNVVDFL